MKRLLLMAIALLVTIGIGAQNYLRVKGVKEQSEVFVKHTSYNLSFNKERLTPNYVAWCLTPDRVKGKVKRYDFFDVDPSLPSNLRVKHGDYSGSRFDRGHMCPSADNRHSQDAMVECFYMSNMCPQNHGLNTGAWNDLEIQCRDWTVDYKKIYIVAGPIYDNSSLRWIGNKSRGHRIAVPDRFFKVVLMVGKETKAIGFIYPNQNVTGEIRKFAKSVDEVEKATGFDFFSDLDDKIENRIESVCNPGKWNL